MSGDRSRDRRARAARASSIAGALVAGASAALLLAALSCGDGEPCGENRYCKDNYICADQTCVSVTSPEGIAAAKRKDPNLDWFTSPCAELGGQTTAAGACFIPCQTDENCPLDSLRCGPAYAKWHCALKPSFSYSGQCGPRGWVFSSIGGICYLACSAVGRDSECPAGYRCVESSGLVFCTGAS